MKSNHGWYYSTQISLRKNHWRNPEPHSNKFLSVTFLNRVHVSFELDSELDAAKSFVNADECERIVFQDYYWDRNVRENLTGASFSTGMTFWFRIVFTWWLGHFISRYLKVLFMLIKYMCDSKSQTLRMRYPFQSTGRPISHRNGWSFRVYMIPLRDFVPEWNSRPGTTTGVNSRRGDSRRHDVLWWYHVNKCRAMSWEGTGVNSLWCESRPGVM